MKKNRKRIVKVAARKRPARRNGKPSSSVATTADVLGLSDGPAPVRKPLIPRRWARQHRNLVRLRSDLREKMGHLSQEALDETPNFSEHMADAGTDSFDRDFALGLLASEQDAVNEIDRALRRIESGTYGVCEVTGKPIPRSRLEAIPWTRFSFEAQRKLEREGTAPRARVGRLREVDSTEAESSGLGSGEEAEEPEKP